LPRKPSRLDLLNTIHIVAAAWNKEKLNGEL
jgi:hypothetical protein